MSIPVSRNIALALAMLTLGCRGSDSDRDSGRAADTPALAQPPAPEAAPPAAHLTAADLDALERGLRREIELVRDVQARSGTAATPEERGRAIQDAFPERTIVLAAQTVGLSSNRYRALRETVARVLTTLDFQGKIEGPMSVDTAHANPELRARLTSDPFAELTPQSASALRAHMGRLTPVWIEYVMLTAVGG